MKLAELLKIWRDKKADVSVPDSFAVKVMAKIRLAPCARARSRRRSGVVDWFGTARIGQVAAIIIGGVIGILRLVILVRVLEN